MGIKTPGANSAKTTTVEPSSGPRAGAAPSADSGSALVAPQEASGADTPASESPIEGRRERHRRETFERLVRAAREIMFNRGFGDITVQDITDAADVGKGTFFNYFPSKEHVVSQLQEYNRRILIKATERVRAGQESPVEAIKEMLRGALCPPGGEWLTYQNNTMRALVLKSDVRALMSHEMQITREYYEILLRLGQEQGSVRTDLTAAELAKLLQTYTAGLTVALWIHATAPTVALVDDVIEKFNTLIEPPRPVAAAAAAGASRSGRAKPLRRPARRPAKRGPRSSPR